MHVFDYELWHCNTSMWTEIQRQCNCFTSPVQFKTQCAETPQHRSDTCLVLQAVVNIAQKVMRFNLFQLWTICNAILNYKGPSTCSFPPKFKISEQRLIWSFFSHQLPVSHWVSPSWRTALKTKHVSHGMSARGQCPTLPALQADPMTRFPVIALVSTHPAFSKVSPVGQYILSRWWPKEMSARVYRVWQWTSFQVWDKSEPS